MATETHHAPFVHLRVHTAYSLAEGALRIPQLVELCRKNRMPAVAVTDTGNLFGALEFALAAADAGVQPIIGCQLAVSREGVGPGEDSAGVGRRSPMAAAPDQLVVLAQNDVGYRNLLALVSDAFLEGDPSQTPQVSLADLEQRNDGLIALTGGTNGAVGRLLADGQGPLAAEALGRLQTLFPDRLYVELQRHGDAVEDRIEAGLVDLAYRMDLPLVATNEAFFADRDMHQAHDALLCIADSAYVSQTDRRRVTAEHYFKSAAEMTEVFADLPEAVANTLVVAQRCAFMPTKRQPILPRFETASGRDETAELRVVAAEGLERRLRDHVFPADETDAAKLEEIAAPYREQLAFELGVIEDMGFPGYFLIVADFIQWAKAQEIPVGPGRGSGAGSVVAWALTITDLDPLRWGLLFERFLNPDRVSMPDFDIDFCQDRRDEVIRYVQDKYGADRVAQIITFGKLQARAVLKDVGRVLEMPYGQVDRLSKLVPNNSANPVTLAQAIESEPALQQARADDEAVDYLLSTALQLEGLFRNSSTHAAGVVIGDRPLVELVPLFRDPRAPLMATQFNMKYAEQAGLVKFDFLGLKTLSVLVRTVELLARRGIEIDLLKLPLDDQKTFDLMSKGDSLGVFQFESTGMRSLLREAGVGAFADIIALVALYRPGPMENIPKYVACKHGQEEPEFLHESIEPVVKDTYGVIIYQEQVMKIAQVFAGYSLGQADLLRRAMGKKIKAEMDAQRDTFIAGAMAKGVDKERAVYVFELVDRFARYGFPKAHSAGYALIAYQTAYMKAHYPVEFIAATMSYDMNNTDKLGIFRQELDRLGHRLLPPDVNTSEPDFIVEALAEKTEDGAPERAIRYALGAVKGVGRAAMTALVAEREENGPFKDLFDLAARIDPQVVNKRQLEHLAASGALDSLVANRAQAHAAVDLMLSHAQSAQNDRVTGQQNLFGGAAERADTPRLPTVPEWSHVHRLEQELAVIGFYLSAHPLDTYGTLLGRLGVVPAASLQATVEGNGGAAAVKIAGTVLSKQLRTSQKGSRFAFVQLSDPTGACEVVLFSEVLAAAAELLDGDRPLLIDATARVDDDRVRLTAQRVRDLEDSAAAAEARLRVWLKDSQGVAPLAALLREEPGVTGGAAAASDRNGGGNGGNGGRVKPKGRISVLVTAGDQEVEIALAGGYACTPQVQGAIKSLPGVLEVEQL